MVSERSRLRPVNGILLLDKPCQITSNAALQIVKRLFGARKAGHTGSLDPLATGMLPICFGEATKFSQFLLEADKSYRVTAKLGVTTTTGDAEGEIVTERTVENFSQQRINEVLDSFKGEIQQVPSMYSALKHQGRPLYELARQGITIERAARPVTIYDLNLVSQTTDTLTLDITCSKGTYVRTLVEDIGSVLGCGAHVIALRRLTTSSFNEGEMISLAEIEKLAEKGDFKLLDAHLLPTDAAVGDLPAVNISEAGSYYLLRGQPIILPRAPASGFVKLFLSQNRFLGIGEILSDGRIAPRRLVSSKD